MQDKTKIALAELIARVNDLFEGDLTPGDKLVYVNDVISGKLMESEKLDRAGDEQHQGAVRQLTRPGQARS